MIRKKNLGEQGELWVRSQDIKAGRGQGFFDKLGEVLDGFGFGEEARRLCAPYYADRGAGRPPVDPEVYFKMLVVGFFEGIGSERGIAARCEDSLMVRRFLRYELTERTPDHTTLSVIRGRLPEEVFLGIFDAVLLALAEAGLLKGRKAGADSSTMEACASLEKLRHRLTGESYWEYVKELAREAGIDPEDDAAVRRFDRKREGRKTSNAEWYSPADPEAKVGRRKDGACDMIYKTEHCVDLESGAIVRAEVLPGDQADSEGFAARALEASATLDEIAAGAGGQGGEPAGGPAAEEAAGGVPARSVVADKGYHQNEEIASLHGSGHRVVIPAPEGKKLPRAGCGEGLRAAAKAALEAVRSEEGKGLLKARSEKVERSFAHLLDCGGMRRTTLTGKEKINKRYLVGAAAFNLSVLLRALIGYGTSKQFCAGNRVGSGGLLALLLRLWGLVRDRWAHLAGAGAPDPRPVRKNFGRELFAA